MSQFDPATRAYLDKLRQDLVIDANLLGQPLRFHTTWGLFSPKEIDDGSRLLLDHVEVRPDDRIFDLGCGYGPLGLTLARLAPQGRALLVDKDFVAVEYSRRNARLNGIDNAEVLLSNGFDQVGERPLDLVVSNLPAKTGKEQYYLYFYDALARMQPGGRFYVVTITGLREFIARSFKEVFGNYEKVKQGKTYTVGLARVE
jgi:16S rRNA (guanine1207-N2)-methyltransferase